MTYVDGFIALSNLSRELLNRRETCHVLLNFLIKVHLRQDNRPFHQRIREFTDQYSISAIKPHVCWVLAPRKR